MQIYVILIACVVLLLCLFFKVPVFISVFAGALVYFLLGASSSPAILAQRIISGTQSIPLLAIPFFICAGVFMNYTGVTKRIMNFCNAPVSYTHLVTDNITFKSAQSEKMASDLRFTERQTTAILELSLIHI